jgi:hypothetical protein
MQPVTQQKPPTQASEVQSPSSPHATPGLCGDRHWCVSAVSQKKPAAQSLSLAQVVPHASPAQVA